MDPPQSNVPPRQEEEALPAYEETIQKPLTSRLRSHRQALLCGVLILAVFLLTLFLWPRVPRVYTTVPIVFEWQNRTSLSLKVPLAITSANFYPFHAKTIRAQVWLAKEQPSEQDRPVKPELRFGQYTPLSLRIYRRPHLLPTMQRVTTENAPPAGVSFTTVTIHDKTIPKRGTLHLPVHLSVPISWHNGTVRAQDMVNACARFGRMKMTLRAEAEITGLPFFKRPFALHTIIVPCSPADLGLHLPDLKKRKESVSLGRALQRLLLG